MRERTRQTGDTLVEVVMSLAILGVTLVTAFNIANLSYSEGVQSREHTQAIYLAQEQAEKLYLYRDTLIANNPSTTTVPAIMTAGAPGNFGVCSGGCSFNTGSLNLQSGPYQPALFHGVQYRVSIDPLSGGSATNAAGNEGEFKISVTWDSAIRTGLIGASSTNQNSVQLNLVLVDKRGIVPRDCSVVGSATCS